MGGGLEAAPAPIIGAGGHRASRTLAAQFATAAADRGQRAAMFIFDESRKTLTSRMTGLGSEFAKALQGGHDLDPPGGSRGAHARRVRQHHQERGGGVGRQGDRDRQPERLPDAMPGERFLTIHLHELLMYLGSQGVATILIGAHQGLIGAQMHTPVTRATSPTP
jgi:circadian clock protein KaiC